MKNKAARRNWGDLSSQREKLPSHTLGQFGSLSAIPSISFSIKKGPLAKLEASDPHFRGALRIWGPRAPSRS
jgi:hypothetical protein